MTTRQHLPSLADRLVLGRSDLRVSPFCLGLVGSPEVIPAAFRAGINFFFLSADMHWPAYEAVRMGLRNLLTAEPSARDQIVVGVVSYTTQPEFCHQPFLEVLEAVPELGHVDLGVIGGSYATDFLTRLAEYEGSRTGGMRSIGATFHDRAAAVTAINHELLDVAFIRYNAGHPGAEFDVFPHVQGGSAVKLFNFKSVSGFVPSARLDALGVPPDNWRPRPTDHYRFVLRQPLIDGILCGLNTIEHVQDLVSALAEGPLSEAEADYLRELAQLEAGELEIDNGTEKTSSEADSSEIP